MTSLVIIILFHAITLFVKEKSDASDAQANTLSHVASNCNIKRATLT